ncbi:unnamed protein product [Polarella glacialis]|uniref:Uncharacterized protein n=1 Tax=Polarella glacialis TaxID=89957 RepID=A0A813K7X1_POLGL|nr:unnamed protein product [Polarella glacialis]
MATSAEVHPVQDDLKGSGKGKSSLLQPRLPQPPPPPNAAAASAPKAAKPRLASVLLAAKANLKAGYLPTPSCQTGKPQLWSGMQCLRAQAPDGHFELEAVADQMHIIYKEACLDVAEIKIYDRLCEQGRCFPTAFVLKMFERIEQSASDAIVSTSDRGDSDQLKEGNTQARAQGSSEERSESLKGCLARLHGPACGLEWVECAKEWMAKQEADSTRDALAASLVEEWFEGFERRSQARIISAEEQKQREEKQRLRNEVARQEETRRSEHWRGMQSRSIGEVPWEAVQTTLWCAGGTGGAALVQIGPSEAVVVKPQAMTAVAEALAGEVAVLIGVRVAVSRALSSAQGEFTAMSAALRSAPCMVPEHWALIQATTGRSREFVAIIEFVPGCLLQGVAGQQALRAADSSRLLLELGSLIALDCLLNNLDRVPAIWHNDGNLSNVMISASGDVVGIDQQVNAIRDPVGREKYLSALRDFCSDARLGRVSGSAPAARIKTAIVENCGVELSEDQCVMVLDGAFRTFRHVAEHRADLAASLTLVGEKLTTAFSPASVDVGLSSLELMLEFVSDCMGTVAEWGRGGIPVGSGLPGLPGTGCADKMDEDGAIEQRSEPTTQKVIRCRRHVADALALAAFCSSLDRPKEELLLEHVREFEEQFVQVYGNRFLFLCPPNEYGIPKFLPTTIRPTHLPYQELYEFKPCAQFLADFFSYDELNPPDRYPTVIPAPASVLTWCAGDCFDLSMALSSLLIGVGYDAYCVSGFAPRFITTRNEARSACPQLEWDNEEKKEDVQAEDDEFVIPKKPPLRSEYQEAKRKAEDADNERMQEEEMKSDSEDDPSSEEDEFENRRIHCWVLIRKGSREVNEDIYIEPTTGRIYEVGRCPYLKLDLIWNHKNLWVNMQVCSASQVQLDLYNSRYFEYVMLDPESTGHENGANPDDEAGGAIAAGTAGEGDEENGLGQAAQILDMPSAWSERPDIPRVKFHDRCYQGEKTIFYHKCKVEQYAPYTQDDGLVQRITLYKDVRRQIPLEIRERFRHRRDKLYERKRRPMQNENVERFLPGRPSTSTSAAGGALKEFREVSAVSRELIFYNSRLDGLVRCVELIGRKMFEHFEDRDDRLAYHSVTLDPSLGTARGGQKSKDTYPVESMGEVPIRKMTQKFARNTETPPDEDIHKICYFISKGEIRVDYHREPGQLTYRSCTYINEDGNLRRLPRSLPQPTQAQVQKLLQMQANSQPTGTRSHQRTQQELTSRRKDEISIRGMRSVQAGKKRDLTIPGSRDDVLEPSVYDLARESARVEGLREGAEEEKQEEQASKVDILKPYLVDFKNKDTGFVQLDSLQAELVAKKCTTDFRKRLTDRAEIIQRRLEEEQDQLRKRRAQMQRRGDNMEREFERYQSQAMFRTQILEQRLARHEMQAPQCCLRAQVLASVAILVAHANNIIRQGELGKVQLCKSLRAPYLVYVMN